jgi:hypothetical protein
MYKLTCLSTHGASGYAPGSYRDGDVIVCGYCGERIQNPRPTGYIVKPYTFDDVLEMFKKWWYGEEKERKPVWNL